MGVGVEYYDRVFAGSQQYRGPAEDSPFCGLWEAVLECIPEGSRVLDVGCGPGQFAELCVKAGHPYIGLDWSHEAVNFARAKHLPGCRFLLVDVEKDPSLIDGLSYDVATFIEFLEHIGKDLQVLSHVPSSRGVVLTVPSYGGREHFRYFHDLDQATHRYLPYVDVDTRMILSAPNTRGDPADIYLLSGCRR